MKTFETELISLNKYLINFAFQLTKDFDKSQDLAQDTFYRALKFQDKFQSGTDLKSWVSRMMKNLWINEWRHSSRLPEHTRYADAEEYVDPNLFLEQRDEEKVFFDSLFGDEVTTAFKKLPEKFKTVVALSDIENLPYKEIAEITKLPMGTVRSQLHRGRKLLNKELRSYAEKEGIIH